MKETVVVTTHDSNLEVNCPLTFPMSIPEDGSLVQTPITY